jgi:hypothetical protein
MIQAFSPWLEALTTLLIFTEKFNITSLSLQKPRKGEKVFSLKRD